MHFSTRRGFLQDSALFSAALAGLAQQYNGQAADKPGQSSTPLGPNDKIRVAVIGVGGQGSGHVRAYAGRQDAQLVALCDADESRVAASMKHVEERQGRQPRYYQDIRKLLEDKDIDAVSIATPNHWHALAAIWAMQAGKDVYVEKPVSHNVLEGRRIVETARKYKKICQTGTQSRSATGMRQSIAYLHSGKLGKVHLARGLCYKLRPGIGKVKAPTAIPKSVDYDLWCGPAPVKPLMRARLHYDWHWVWDTGNGDLGNQGIHEMDKARWGLNKNELPRSVISLGGRFGYVDDGETANTQILAFDYGDCELIFEVRGLPSTSPYPDGVVKVGKLPSNFVGNIWYGTEGVLVCPSYTSGIVLNNDLQVVTSFSGGEDHFANFLKAVRSRKVEDLNADILEGHLSSALCHLGNISYRLGVEQPFDKGQVFGNDKEATATLERMTTHLRTSGVKLEETKLRVGPRLQIDTRTETFIGNRDANQMLTREYRKGFEVPSQV